MLFIDVKKSLEGAKNFVVCMAKEKTKEDKRCKKSWEGSALSNRVFV
jgi:hypothetical protein